MDALKIRRIDSSFVIQHKRTKKYFIHRQPDEHTATKVLIHIQIDWNNNPHIEEWDLRINFVNKVSKTNEPTQ